MNNAPQPQPQNQPQANAGGFGNFVRRYWHVATAAVLAVAATAVLVGSTCNSYDRKADRVIDQGLYLDGRAQDLGKPRCLKNLLNEAIETRNQYREVGGR